MSSFIHPKGLCETDKIGAGTRIWAFTHILPGARIGADCNICDHVFIENDVVIGDRVTIKSGVQLWDGITVEDDVFLGPNATFSNDRFPRSKQRPDAFPRTLVCRGASLGANATILPGLTIGRNAMVGAGSVVTTNVPANAIVSGNPARITGYVACERPGRLDARLVAADATGAILSTVRGVAIRRLKLVEDMRGNLTTGAFGADVPFLPKRYFIVFGIEDHKVRGAHALKTTHQFVLCVHGACSLLLDDGSAREVVELNTPNLGIYLPPLTWSMQYKHSADAVLAVFCSALYDPEDYVRDYDAFVALASGRALAVPVLA
jgi:acetyltransferase-like isoleucine patch superfamily enzyme